MDNNESLFSSAQVLHKMEGRLDGAERNKGNLAEFILNERYAVELEIISRLKGEQSVSFGEYDDFIDYIVKNLADIVEDVELEEDLLKAFFSSRSDVEIVIKGIKKHGYDWIPDRFLLTGKYVALSAPLMLMIFEPLRVAFISAYIARTEKDLVPITLAFYIATTIGISIQETKLLKDGNPFVMNPYVSILALKFKPQLASLFTRIPRVLTDIFVGLSIYLASLNLGEETQELISPILATIVVWNLMEMLGNKALPAIQKKLLSKDKPREEKSDDLLPLHLHLD